MFHFRRLFGSQSSTRKSKGKAPTITDQQQDFKVLTENSGDVIMRLGPGGFPTYVSPSSLRVLGWTPEEMIGHGPEAFIHPDDVPLLAAAKVALRDSDGGDSRLTFRIRKRDESWLWVEENVRIVLDPVTGTPGDTVLTLRDVSERKALEDQLSAMALTDVLTGLANRRAFDEALDREWRRTLRDGSQMSLLLIDVDHFKSFNDQYGHQVGDDCLRAVAAALTRAVRRPGDTLARYGGEEIAVVLPNTGNVDAVHVANQLRTAIESLQLTHAGNLEGGGVITVSIGAATALARTGGTTGMPAGLLQAADTALYKAKNKGRNRVEASVLLAPDESTSSQSPA